MYKLVKERRAWWPVVFKGVTEEGRVVENKVEFRFTIHSEDDHAQLLASAAGLRDRAEELVREEVGDIEVSQEELAEKKLTILSRLYAEFVERFATDWRGIGAENGDPLRFEPENLRLFMNVPGTFKATFEAYAKCRIGEKEARAGN